MSFSDELKRWGPIALAIPVAAIVGAKLAQQPSKPGGDANAPVTSRTAPRPSPTSDPAVAKGWVGLLTERRELPEGGVRIVEVFAGSPAGRAGLEPGDVIANVNGTAATVAALVKEIGATPIGGRVTLQVRKPTGESSLAFLTVVQSSGIEALLGRTIASGAKGLAALQDSRGLWPHFHEDPRGGTRPGIASSALACAALAAAGVDAGKEAKEALAKGVAALLARRAPDGGLADPEEEIPHRVYANACLLLALAARPKEHAAELAQVRDWLARDQVAEETVDELDYHFGGWNYYEGRDLSRLRTDVSVAAWALEALAAAGLPADRPEWARAGRFLERCQNADLVSRAEADRGREAPLRDGGFAFMPRFSKAGSSDVSDELVVYRSYGSATADGVRGLLAASGGKRDAGADAALRWLARNFTVELNPGFGDADPVGWSRGIHFYWLAALARALHAARVDRLGKGQEMHAWPDELARFLSNAQEAQGTWRSPNGRMAEDSRTVATSFALLALAAARDRLLARDGSTVDGGEGPPPPRPELQPWTDAPGSVLERGRRLFLDHGRTACTTCHQDSGASNGPSLVGVADRYLEKERAHDAAADYLRHHIRDPETWPGTTGRKWDTKMPAYNAGTLSDAELSDLVEFLLSRSGSLPVSGASVPLDGAAAPGPRPPSAERGGELADRLRCTSCHDAKKAVTLLGFFSGLARQKGAAGARAELEAKLASHPRATSPDDVRDLVEFLKQAR